MRNRNGFEELFCLRSNLSNDNHIITALRPSLKTGMDCRDLVCKRVWKITFFWSEIGQGQDLENRAADPQQEFPGVIPPGHR